MSWRLILGWWFIRNRGIMMDGQLIHSGRVVLVVCGMVAGGLNRLEGANGRSEIIGSQRISQRIHRVPSVKRPLRNRNRRTIPDCLANRERIQGDRIKGRTRGEVRSWIIGWGWGENRLRGGRMVIARTRIRGGRGWAGLHVRLRSWGRLVVRCRGLVVS